jgi:hypothetical protein
VDDEVPRELVVRREALDDADAGGELAPDLRVRVEAVVRELR